MFSIIAIFGPVAEAAHGGHSSPTFDLLVGFGTLAAIWIGFSKRKAENTAAIWTAVGASLVSLVFIGFGLLELVRP